MTKRDVIIALEERFDEVCDARELLYERSRINMVLTNYSNEYYCAFVSDYSDNAADRVLFVSNIFYLGRGLKMRLVVYVRNLTYAPDGPVVRKEEYIRNCKKISHGGEI